MKLFSILASRGYYVKPRLSLENTVDNNNIFVGVGVMGASNLL